MDYKKIVWAYMVENGRLTNGLWSFYGGNWESEFGYDWKKIEPAHRKMKESIKDIGVDWDKTREPVGSIEPAFTDTFHDAEDVQTLLGTIYLRDGTEYLIGCKDVDEDIAAYVKMVRKVDENEERVRTIFGE